MKKGSQSAIHQTTLISEDRLQQDCAMWFKNTYKHFAKAFYMINNAGTKTKVRAAQDKAMGITRGVPDTHLVVPRGAYHSLFVEFKVGKNVLSPEQKATKAFFESLGHKVVVCYSLQEFQEAIVSYLFPYHEARLVVRQGEDVCFLNPQFEVCTNKLIFRSW
jgi:hypothetical protein